MSDQLNEVFVAVFHTKTGEHVSRSLHTNAFLSEPVAREAIQKFCALKDPDAQLQSNDYGVVKFTRSFPEQECPQCHRQSYSTKGGHGGFCTDIRCKWGWEIASMSGEPSQRCPRCGIGVDNDGDGNCAVCAKIPDTNRELAQNIETRLQRMQEGFRLTRNYLAAGKLQGIIESVQCLRNRLILGISPAERFAANGVVDWNNPGTSAQQSTKPSLSSFQKLVLRSLLFLVRTQHASTILLEGVEPLVEDIRRVIEQ